MARVISQYSLYWCDLTPTFGHQVNKTRPCIVVSPDEMNKAVGTAVVVPLTTKLRDSPFRLRIESGAASADALIDQIRAIDQRKVKGFISVLSDKDSRRLQQLMIEAYAK